MKKWLYFVIGVIMSVVGLGFADIVRRMFHGEQAIANLLAYGMYLCIVMITCTGIIVSKIEAKKGEK